MLTLTGQVMKVFTTPPSTNPTTGEVREGFDKVQIMGEVPLQGGESKLELFELRTNRGEAFRRATGKRVRCAVDHYAFKGERGDVVSGLFLMKNAEIEMIDEKGNKTGLLDQAAPGRRAS